MHSLFFYIFLNISSLGKWLPLQSVELRKILRMRVRSYIRNLLLVFALTAAGVNAGAQRVLSLQECRELAVRNNHNLAIAREKSNAAEYDRKTARSNYLPKLSVTGAYMHNSEGISMLDNAAVSTLSGIGTAVSSGMEQYITQMMADPEFWVTMLVDPGMRYLISQASALDIEGPLNAIGQKVAEKFQFDVTNVFVGAVTLEEPLYAGGKIRAYNKVAGYAQELAEVQLKGEEGKIIVTTDEAYWQIVSIAAKLKLADQYVGLLQNLNSDVEKMRQEGVATMSDQLSVKVKLNEAEMIQVKAKNGLALSKMLLCQLCGLEIDSDITLADENGIVIDDDIRPLEYTVSDIEENRTELKSLRLAVKMYDQKTKIVKSDYLPALAVMGNYVLTNPNLSNGFDKSFHGLWNVSVVARVPVFHFGEGMNKVRHARSDALIAKYQLDDAREKISLQVSQYEKKIDEAEVRLAMAGKNMENAEENLRMANVGFSEGVLESSVVMQAQTAWMQARSEEIDARIDRIMANVYLRKATGMWNN